jgi:hemerythrin-like domain-containing protein
MKATELLVSQHREVEQLFEQLESVEEGDEKIVREELARNLIGHMVIEEEMFYPAMREAMPEQISLAEVEHAAARYALAQVLAASPSDPTFRAKVMVLEQMVRNHVDMEEKEILPRSEGALGADQHQQLTRSMEGRYEEVVSEDFIGMLKLRIMKEMPQMLVPRAAAGKTATKKRAVHATAKKATSAAKRGAGAKRGASTQRGASAKRGASATRGAPTKRTAETKRATGTSGTKRQPQQSTTRRTGMAGGRPTSKRSARKRA